MCFVGGRFGIFDKYSISAIKMASLDQIGLITLGRLKKFCVGFMASRLIVATRGSDDAGGIAL